MVVVPEEEGVMINGGCGGFCLIVAIFTEIRRFLHEYGGFQAVVGGSG